MPTLAEQLLMTASRPMQTGLGDAFRAGQADKRRQNLMGSLAMGAPREQVLQDLAYVDPMMAGKEQGVFRTGIARETDAQRRIANRQQNAPLRQEIAMLENKIRASLKDPNYDPTEEFGLLQTKIAEYDSKTGEDLKSSLFDLENQMTKRKELGLKMQKEGRDQTAFKQKTIDRFRKDWTSTIDVLKNIPKIRTFANQAKKGSQVGFQNLLKSVSRMGSNEALSDSERESLASGNIVDRLEAMFSRLGGTGVSASKKDVSNLLSLIDEMVPRLMNQMQANYKEQQRDLIADTGAGAQETKRRALKGIPTKWAPVSGPVSGFAEVEKKVEVKTPSAEAPTPTGTNLDDIANMLKGS